MNARRLPVRPHLRPAPRRLRCTDPKNETALVWVRQSEPDPHGWWWSPNIAVPALLVESLPTWGEA
jgi:hypothetical protein